MINFEGTSQVNNKIMQLSLNKLEKILPSDNIDLLIKKIQSRAELEMTDTGTFKPIVEKFTNNRPVIELGDVSLNIKADSASNSSQNRTLEAVITTKSKDYALRQELVTGDRDTVLKFLKNKDFNENFKRFLMECSNEFEIKGLD